MMRRIPLLALSSALCFSTPILRAQEPAPKPEADAKKAQAAQRFDRGLQLFNEGDNAGALAEFKQTYALLPNALVLYNIGLVYAAMGRPVDAVDALKSVIDSATLSPAQREQAQKSLADQAQRIGRVAVSTAPDGARIDIDGVEVARTPLTAPLRVAEGSHVIGAVAEGYAHARKEIIVAGNADAALSFELVLSSAKRPANLTIRSRVVDAEVKLDGKVIGKTPLATSLAVPAGKHSVELTRPGYHSAKQDVEVGESATGEVNLDLDVDSQALVRDGAELSLDLREAKADLTLDDEHLGVYTQPLRLPIGVHHVRLQVAGYLPFDQDVVLSAGQDKRLTPYLLPTPETRKAHDDDVRLHRTWGWISVGAGALLAGGGVAWLAANSSSKDSARKEFDLANMDTGVCSIATGGNFEQCNANRADAKSRLDSANSKDVVGFIGLAVGGAAIVTGVVLLVTGESSHRFDPPKSARSGVRRLALTPGPGQLGLGLSAAF
jgi:tetratricopeptide (TPR) repeat protein